MIFKKFGLTKEVCFIAIFYVLLHQYSRRPERGLLCT